MPKLSEIIFGKKGGVSQLSNLTPEQQASLAQILGITQDQLPDIFKQLGEFDIGDQSAYQQGSAALEDLLKGFDTEQATQQYQEAIARPAIQQFNEQVLPGIQERFTGSGSGRGSAAQRQLAQAGTQLQSNLASGQASYLQQGEAQNRQAQLGALSQALGFAQAPQQSLLENLAPLLQLQQLGLGTQAFQNVQRQGTGGLFGGILGGLGGAAGSSLFNRLFGG